MAKRSEEGDNADDDQHGDMSRPLLQSAPNTIPEARPPSPSALPHYSSSSSPLILDGFNGRADQIAVGSWRACAFIIGKI